jgi:cyanophycin synthetase
VLNANDPHCVAMAPYSAGRIRYFALDGNHPVIVRHRSVGGEAIFVRDNTIIVAEGPREEAFMPLKSVPLTHGGRVVFHVENTLAAIAAALALKVPAEVIRARAQSFTADIDKVPTRFNILEIHGATVIVDYGHNADSLAALVPVLDKFPHPRRTCVYTTPGDRRDCDMVRQGELLGEAFDHVILYEDHNRRGRAEGEIIRLFRKGLENGKRVRQIDEIHDPGAADQSALRGANAGAAFALRGAKPGDLILLQCYTVDETVAFLREYLEAIAPEPVLDETIIAPTAPPADEADEPATPAAAAKTVAAVAKV